MIIFKTMFSFMKIGILAFGGAYAAIPLIEKEIVEVQRWMSYQEFADLLALDELTPGPILINSATFVGMKVDGMAGAIAATIGCILPSCIISLIMFLIYRKYQRLSYMESALRTLKCMAIALIFSTLINIIHKNLFINSDINHVGIVLMLISFLILRKCKVNPVFIMIGCGIINLLVR